jgi:hypothetical protein
MADDDLRINWWRFIEDPFVGWRVVAAVASADLIPERLPRKGAVLVGPRSTPKWVAFDCPCRTGHRIMLNTDRSREPYWSATVKGKLTISPSVDYKQRGQRCHYIVRNGRIEWVHRRKAR